MGKSGNIVIGDETALHFLMHSDAGASWRQHSVKRNPLVNCAHGASCLSAFNYEHPLFGKPPVTLLVDEPCARRKSNVIDCRDLSARLPSGSFFELRDNLFMASPELVFLRSACAMPLARLVELGCNLCARYYLAADGGRICDRSEFLTTPNKLASYLKRAEGLRGSGKARNALAHVVPNSGSPAESKTWVQFCLPLRNGGLGLPFKVMNYDVKAGRSANLTAQGSYCIDIANPDLNVGLEYDGKDYHQDASKDKLRRNELQLLGWEIYPIDATVLYDAEKTLRLGKQLSKRMGKRFRTNETWEKRYRKLRESIGLPT